MPTILTCALGIHLILHIFTLTEVKYYVGLLCLMGMKVFTFKLRINYKLFSLYRNVTNLNSNIGHSEQSSLAIQTPAYDFTINTKSVSDQYQIVVFVALYLRLQHILGKQFN